MDVTHFSIFNMMHMIFLVIVFLSSTYAMSMNIQEIQDTDMSMNTQDQVKIPLRFLRSRELGRGKASRKLGRGKVSRKLGRGKASRKLGRGKAS